MKTYRISEILSKTRSQKLSYYNFENLLSYYADDDFNKIVGNINTGINIIIDDPSLLERFHVTTDMFWPQASQLIYGTDSMYWFLQLLNPHLTKGKSPFDKIKAPNHVYYLPGALLIIRNASL